MQIEGNKDGEMILTRGRQPILAGNRKWGLFDRILRQKWNTHHFFGSRYADQ